MQSFARQVGRVVGKTAARGSHHQHPSHVPSAHSAVGGHDVIASSGDDDHGLHVGRGRAAYVSGGAFSDAEIEAVRHDLFDQETEWLADSGPALAALSGDQQLEEKLDLEQNFLVNEASLSMGVRLAKIPEFQQQVLANPACANALGFDTAFLPYLEPGTHESDHDSLYESEPDSDAPYDNVFDSYSSSSSSSRSVRRHQLPPRKDAHHQKQQPRSHRLRRSSQNAAGHHSNAYGRRPQPQPPHGRGLSDSRLFSSAASDDMSPFPEILQPGANGRKLASGEDAGEWGVGDTVYRVWSWFWSFLSGHPSNQSGGDLDTAGEIPAHEIERVLREQPEGHEEAEKEGPPGAGRGSSSFNFSDKVSSAIAIATVIVIAVVLKRSVR